MGKTYFLIASILLTSIHLFAQKVKISEYMEDENRPKYGPFYHVEFEAPQTLVIDTFSLGMLDWFGNLLKNDTNYRNKYDILMNVNTCRKESGKSINYEQAKVVIDYLHYKYGIDRKHFPIKVGNIGYPNSFCNRFVWLCIHPAKNKYLTKFKKEKDVSYYTIHFGFKSLMIDTNDYIYLDSLALKITTDSAFIPYDSYTDISFLKKYDIYLVIHCCEEEKDSFMGLERAKEILDYL